MKTTPTQPVTTSPAAPEALPASGTTLIPTGEAQVGVVKKAPPPPSVETERPEPVLEHPVHVPEAATDPTPASPVEVAAAAVPVQPTVAERAASLAAAVQPPLQDSPQVSIPARMNHLQSENKRLRDEMQVLEKALKKSLS